MKLQSLQFYINSKTIKLHRVKSVIILAEVVLLHKQLSSASPILMMAVAPASIAILVDIAGNMSIASAHVIVRVLLIAPAPPQESARPTTVATAIAATTRAIGHVLLQFLLLWLLVLPLHPT